MRTESFYQVASIFRPLHQSPPCSPRQLRLTLAISQIKRLRRTVPDWILSRDSARNGGAWGKFEFTGGSTLAAASSRQLHGDLILPAARDILGKNCDLRHRILRFAPPIGIAIEWLALRLHIGPDLGLEVLDDLNDTLYYSVDGDTASGDCMRLFAGDDGSLTVSCRGWLPIRRGKESIAGRGQGELRCRIGGVENSDEPRTSKNRNKGSHNIPKLLQHGPEWNTLKENAIYWWDRVGENACQSGYIAESEP